jgi:hypothetical protein
MHIDLNAENRAKVLEACGKTGMSAPQIVNLFLSAVEITELTQLVTVKSTIPNGQHPADVPRVMRKKVRIMIGGD